MTCIKLTFTSAHVSTWLEQYRCLLVRANNTLFNLDNHILNTFSVGGWSGQQNS